MIQNRKKRICIILLVIGLLILSGCKARVDENGSRKAEDGRLYGGVISGEIGENVSTAFFDMTVEEAQTYETYQFGDSLYQADDNYTYLLVKIKLKNIFEKELPMSINDFVLDYEDRETEHFVTGYGQAQLENDDFMENVYQLKQGKSITKYIMFMVPKKEAYTLVYTEHYEDQFEGNQFQICMNPINRQETQDSTAREITKSE